MSTASSSTAAPTRLALQVAAVLTVAGIAFQFVTAGQLLSSGELGLHSSGTVVLHVLAGLTVVAAALHRRATSGPWWPTVVAAAVFACTFLQASTGAYDTAWAHVPGALVLTVGALAVAGFALRR